MTLRASLYLSGGGGGGLPTRGNQDLDPQFLWPSPRRTPSRSAPRRPAWHQCRSHHHPFSFRLGVKKKGFPAGCLEEAEGGAARAQSLIWRSFPAHISLVGLTSLQRLGRRGSGQERARLWRVSAEPSVPPSPAWVTAHLFKERQANPFLRDTAREEAIEISDSRDSRQKDG